LLPERVVQTGKVLRNSIYVNNDIEQEAIIAVNIFLSKRPYMPIIGEAKCIGAHPPHAGARPPHVAKYLSTMPINVLWPIGVTSLWTRLNGWYWRQQAGCVLCETYCYAELVSATAIH